MSRFDDFVDEFVFMAKNAADVATKKTGEVVETSKIRYQMKQIEWEIEKAYAKLGAIVYEARKSDDSFDEIIQLAMSEIDDLKEKYDSLSDKLRQYKNVVKCPGCGKENELNSSFCSRCGTPLAGEEPVVSEEEPRKSNEPIRWDSGAPEENTNNQNFSPNDDGDETHF